MSCGGVRGIPRTLRHSGPLPLVRGARRARRFALGLNPTLCHDACRGSLGAWREEAIEMADTIVRPARLDDVGKCEVPGPSGRVRA